MQCVPENNLSDNQYRTCDTSAASFSQKSKSLEKMQHFTEEREGFSPLILSPNRRLLYSWRCVVNIYNLWNCLINSPGEIAAHRQHDFISSIQTCQVRVNSPEFWLSRKTNLYTLQKPREFSAEIFEANTSASFRKINCCDVLYFSCKSVFINNWLTFDCK